jgi:4-oxalocrotonate tautomerase
VPHILVKMVAGRTPEQKSAIAEALTTALMQTAGSGRDDVSVAIEDVAAADWMSAVYEPEIAGKPETIFKTPGYGPPR